MTRSAMTSMIDTDEDWEKFAQHDPYFSVLTQPRFAGIADDAARKAQFFQSGAAHVAHLIEQLRPLSDAPPADWSVLDFGCGVGRLLVPFAQSCRHAAGVDVSPTMLDEARRNCASHGCANVTIGTLDELPADRRFGLVHSFIVFQHIPPRRGMALLQQLLDRVEPEGLIALHFSFARAYPHHAAGWKLASRFPQLIPLLRLLRGENPFQRRMLMMRYDLNEVLRVLHAAGIRECRLQVIDERGNLGALILGRSHADADRAAHDAV